jgi:hypothetical protein
MNELALNLPATATFADWSSLGHRLCTGARQINWLIGDWLIEGSERFGDRARDEANAIFRTDVERFDPIVRTCRRFPEPRRHAALSFGHHLAVLPIDSADEADQLLTQAETKHLSPRDLRREVTAHRMQNGSLFPRVDDDPEDTAMRLIVQAWNRAPVEARGAFLELAAEAEMGVIDL